MRLTCFLHVRSIGAIWCADDYQSRCEWDKGVSEGFKMVSEGFKMVRLVWCSVFNMGLSVESCDCDL